MKVSIHGIDEVKKSNRKKVSNAILRVLGVADLKKYSINLSLVDETTIENLYFRFKKKYKVTDVLSFPVPKMEKLFEHTKYLLGDVVICLEQAKRQSEEFGHDLAEELAVLSVHGLFHLLGYDHEISKEEANIQMQGEMYLLEKAGFSPSLSLLGRI